MSFSGRAMKSGYILVSTIWVLAFLSIAAASIGEWYGRSLSVAAARVDGARSRVEELSTRATLMYAIATGDIGRSGIFLDAAAEQDESAADGFGNWVRSGVPDIIFDGTVYQGYGGVRFSIQDESGLWGLTPETPQRSRGLLLSRGLSFDEADVLASRLADYVDSDDLVRINGAEASDYRFAGLAPPTNSRLESVYELKRVMGWADVDAIWRDDGFAGLISLVYWGSPNIGLAPREVLLQLPGATPELVGKLLEMRHGEAEADAEVNAWINDIRSRDSFSAPMRPSSNMRMRFWRAGERQLREYSVKFSAGDQNPAPWVIENNHRRALSRDLDSEPAKVTQLPAFLL
jgi:hypothetical protein